MKKLIGVLLVDVVLYQGWQWWQRQSVPPLKPEPYLVVYGRDSCGYTQQTLQALDQADIAYEYQIVDDPAVADVLHTRMRRHGLETRHYLLPVVDLNNRFSIRPDQADLVADARKLGLKAAR